MAVARYPLILAPTPCHPLPNLSRQLGIDLWIKRDDLTGFAGGGNKGRKLEYLIGDALAMDADTVVTCGGLQSNFIRQLAVACAMVGLKCVAAAMELPFDEAAGPAVGERLQANGGNVLIDQLAGCDLRIYPDGDWLTLYRFQDEIATELTANGAKVYSIPIGGSAPLGAFAFFQAAEEVAGQEFDWIVTASSSGSTQVGLAHRFSQSNTKVLGVCSDPEPEIVEDFAELSAGLGELTGLPAQRADEFVMDFDCVGPGYGIPSEEGMDALQLMLKAEGILLDPIYSSKAFAGLLNQVRAKQVQGKVLFWHTGGVPALFALNPGSIKYHSPTCK